MDNTTVTSWKHVLPALPYPQSALEPHIDGRTLLLHHGKHHASYVQNLNEALAGYPDLQGRDVLWLLLNAGKLPQRIRASVRNNAGGHVNHSLLWRAMAAAENDAPAGPLADAIARDFGSLDEFKRRFEEAGAKVFGSGWVWLVRTGQDGGRLRITTTAGHDNPLTKGHFPILLNDVWEHAYYLKHHNRRADYLKGWWPLVSWKEAARRFESSSLFSERGADAEGGLAHGEAA